MALSLSDHKAMLAGFAGIGFVSQQAPTTVANPIRIEWHLEGKVFRYRLWAFEISHGGGGPTVRAADEFRIQITNGPSSRADIDKAGAQDLLLGYSRDRDAIVAYDRRWLERWIDSTAGGSRASPSVQVKDADIQAGHNKGIHHLTKSASFGEGYIVTMSPALLPAYLLNNKPVLQGTMTATEAQAATPKPAVATVVDYCRTRGLSIRAGTDCSVHCRTADEAVRHSGGSERHGKIEACRARRRILQRWSGKRSRRWRHSDPWANFCLHAGEGRSRSQLALRSLPSGRIGSTTSRFSGSSTRSPSNTNSTQALDLILRARQAHDVAHDKNAAPRYFMLLDEMNLARVEHYFSDWLSCTESRRLQGMGRSSSTPSRFTAPRRRWKRALSAWMAHPQKFRYPQILNSPRILW